MAVYGIALDEKNNPVLSELKTAPLKDKRDAQTSLDGAIAKLNHIYEQIPQPGCDKCGSCCDGTKAGDPNLYSLEYLNIMRFLNDPENKPLKTKIYGEALLGKGLLDKRVKEEANFKEKSGFIAIFCPAFDPQTKLCRIYRHRPLICRIYGMEKWHKEKSQNWVREKGEAVCDRVKIDDDELTEYWPLGKGMELFKQLSILSNYHYLDQKTVFKNSGMSTWFTLKAME